MFSTIKRQGFTLVELLLGLIIFSLIAVSLYNMLYNGIKLDSKAQYIHKTYNEARMAFDALGRELPNAIPYDFSASNPQRVAFSGSSKEITFLMPTPQGISVVRYYAGRPDMGTITKTLVSRVTKNLKSIVSSSKEEVPVDFLLRQAVPLASSLNSLPLNTQPEILSVALKKTEGFQLEYGSGKTMVWESQWNKPSLPAAVRVTLTLFTPEAPDTGVVLTREIYLPQGNMQE